MTAKELSQLDHPYYGSGQYEESYDTFDDFVEEMEGYDVDLNLCYRFDVHESDEDDGFTCTLITIRQRKGGCTEHYVKKFTDEDIPKLEKYLQPHLEVLNKIISPFNK